ncbi:hypothetical protein MLD52_13820, partial [Puniceicoccaceae bacterium K14]|nr:hypothetical protein [Puniceicoccaceae bacterium K14]
SSAVVDVIATKHTTLFKNSRELYQGAWHDAYTFLEIISKAPYISLPSSMTRENTLSEPDTCLE